MTSVIAGKLLTYFLCLFLLRVAFGRPRFDSMQVLMAIAALIATLVGWQLGNLLF